MNLEKILEGMKKVEFENGVVSVAEGEGRGHHHTILERPGVEVYRNDEKVAVVTKDEPTVLDHCRHGQITIPANDVNTFYIQEEYDPENEYRKVMD